MQRFAEALADGLKQVGIVVSIIRPRPFFGRLQPSVVGPGKWLGYIDKFVICPFRLRRLANAARNRAVVFHICDHSNAMYGAWLRDVPVLVTCHDLLAVRSALGEFPHNPTKWSGRILQRWILSGLKNSRRVACVSDATRMDLMRLAGLPEECCRTVYNGLNFSYRKLDTDTVSATLLEAFGRVGKSVISRYLFHVGGSQWYKNRIGLIKIYRELVHIDSSVPDLVIAGKPHAAKVEKEIRESGLLQRIHYIGHVSNEELNALYAGAEAFLFPSLAEGFGWPIIEAQASGCPVVTTDRPPMNEFGGKAGVYVNPEKPSDAATAISGLLAESNDDRQERIDNGLKNAARFSTDRMIQGYIREYERLVSAG